MRTAKPRTNISGYFNEVSRRLRKQAEIMTPIVVHHGEMGDNDHLWFAELLRKHLPTRIGVDTGFVVNYESDKNSMVWFATTKDHRATDESIGPQSDILLTDVHGNAPLCPELAFRVCPVEMVLGVIEVTRLLDTAKLVADLQKIQRVRALAHHKKKRYVGPVPMSLRPRAYLVGIDSDLELKSIVEQLKKIDDDLRPNAILLLNKALYVRRAYSLDFMKVEKDILFQFIALLRVQIGSFPVGQTDLSAYLSPVAELVEHADGARRRRVARQKPKSRRAPQA
jgi:hypothetical protein